MTKQQLLNLQSGSAFRFTKDVENNRLKDDPVWKTFVVDKIIERCENLNGFTAVLSYKDGPITRVLTTFPGDIKVLLQ